MKRLPPREAATKITQLLKKQHPDPSYVKKIFQYVRDDLGLKGGRVQSKRLPELLTHEELKRLYETVWYGSNAVHIIMLKLLLFTGIRNSELIHITLEDVDLDQAKIRIAKRETDTKQYVFFPPYFREELSLYMQIQAEKGAVYLFESNRSQKFSTRWIREIVKKYATEAGITKRVYPNLFRHQVLSYLSEKGLSDTELQAVSGHKNRESLSIYKDLNQAEVDRAYWEAMKEFSIQ